jgi:uncharacterized protein (TIGR03790 family)
MSKRSLFLFAALAIPCVALALGPHEVLVLANDKSADSVQVAKDFVRLRQVPESNIVRVSVPVSDSGVPEEISPEAFTREIWEPAVKAMRERGIGDHILAWVYSADFPTRINTGGPSIANISVQGLTFLRNVLPEPSIVSNGWYVSQLFTGPNNPNSPPYLSRTLDFYAEWLGKDMPLPSMMLGHTGRNGTDMKTIAKCMENGLASDGTMPKGTIYFVTSVDARSVARQWQFPMAKKMLSDLGVKAVITDSFPKGMPDVMGLMMGVAFVDPEQGNCYLPGCMAEHFTSSAGIFDADDQTKLSAWIKAGATASDGAVTEPYAKWPKFPGAQFFVHYASGCTMIESFYQAIKCPLQLAIIGDPLAQPWAPKAILTIGGLNGDTVSGKVKLQADVKSESGGSFGKYVYLLDGRIVGRGRIYELDTSKIQNGLHTLRAVASRTGEVKSQVFAEKIIMVAKIQRPVAGDQSLSASAEAVTNRPVAKKMEADKSSTLSQDLSRAKVAPPENEDKKAHAEQVAPFDGGVDMEGAGRR